MKLFLLFLMGGCIYGAIEIGCRGFTHYSMFITGGICFVLIGGLNNYISREMPLLLQMLFSSLIVTALEFCCGCIVNLWLGLHVWDYSLLPLNVCGQICIPFTAVWFLLSFAGIFLDDFFRQHMFGEEKMRYVIIRKSKVEKPLAAEQ